MAAGSSLPGSPAAGAPLGRSPSPLRLSPPLRVQGSGGVVWRLLNTGLPAVAVGSLGLWGGLHLGLAELWAWVLASKLVALTGAGLALRRPRVHVLAWDGQQWLLDGRPSVLRLMLDLGPWMLLQARPQPLIAHDTEAGATARAPGLTWLPLAAVEAGTAWGALRAAVYLHPAPAASMRPAQDPAFR